LETVALQDTTAQQAQFTLCRVLQARLVQCLASTPLRLLALLATIADQLPQQPRPRMMEAMEETAAGLASSARLVLDGQLLVVLVPTIRNIELISQSLVFLAQLGPTVALQVLLRLLTFVLLAISAQQAQPALVQLLASVQRVQPVLLSSEVPKPILLALLEHISLAKVKQRAFLAQLDIAARPRAGPANVGQTIIAHLELMAPPSVQLGLTPRRRQQPRPTNAGRVLLASTALTMQQAMP